MQEHYPSWLTTLFLTGQRMLNFVSGLELYMHYHVIESNWLSFMQTLESCHSVEVLNKSLADFLSTVLDQCLIADSSLADVIRSINQVCIQFADFTSHLYERFVTRQDSKDGRESVLTAPSMISELTLSQQGTRDYLISMARLESEFTALVVDLLSRLRSSNCMSHLNLSDHLDPNQYYAGLGSAYHIDDTTSALITNHLESLAFSSGEPSVPKSLMEVGSTLRRSRSRLALKKHSTPEVHSKDQLLSNWVNSIPQQALKRPSLAGFEQEQRQSLHSSVNSLYSRTMSQNQESSGHDSVTIKPNFPLPPSGKMYFRGQEDYSDGDSI
ncbi:Gamma-tubulin complex component 2 [Cichlidogyrus casuarinus]|uniref:Gamma-tubulin complex component n=1 Tax=Cichlidogyrus casuarinus TaxID=1844966 RepID=A0ABD2PTQ2_9PLAT